MLLKVFPLRHLPRNFTRLGVLYDEKKKSTMPDLGFQDQNQNRLLSGFKARDFSPDSVIFTTESNFSLFSSASCSVERCSFASDVHDQDSVVSRVFQHFSGHRFQETLGGPDPDPNNAPVNKNSHLARKIEKGKVQKLDNETEPEDENYNLDSARSSFSRALKECQDRRSRSEALLKKPNKQRPASVELINVTNSSPRLGIMKKTSIQNRQIGSFPSPGTPNYRHTSVGIQKGWSSERIPSQSNPNKKNLNNTTAFSFNNGRTLPSKWEDAERWIFSPVSGDNGGVRSPFPQVQRRPKSKSGPLGRTGVAYHSMCSPAGGHMFDGQSIGDLMVGSPLFSAGMKACDHFCGGGRGGAGNYNERTEPCMSRSVSIHGCSEQLNQLFLTGTHDEKYGGVKDTATDISSRAISRRDMATQMSPEGSPSSSPTKQGHSPSSLAIVEFQRLNSSRTSEVRDVQIDERVTMTRWSKKNRTHFTAKGTENVEDWSQKPDEIQENSARWEITATANSISKIKREEAKITAWENLQKAKAEAAMRKLEMKLEKKRSSSMDKIMKKLKCAQRKAQEMRSSVSSSNNSNNNHQQLARNSHKFVSIHRTRQIGSLSGCFTCHAF